MSKIPRDDLAGYVAAYPAEMGLGTDDPAEVLDRYHAPDIRYVSDGNEFDRDRLVAHAAPVRRNALAVRVDVHDAIVEGDRVAARYTMVTELRKRGEVVIDVHMFGRLAADGRLHRIDQVTRTVS